MYYFRVCKDRSGDELTKLGFSLGLLTLDKRIALQHTAIADVRFAFLPGRKYAVTRYGDGSWPVLYTALDHLTAINEVAFHSRKEWMAVSTKHKSRNARKMLYSLEIDSNFGFSPTVTPALMSSDDYSYCQEVARDARLIGYHYIEVPSVRKSGGKCRPVFEDHCIKLHVGAESIFSIFWTVSTDLLHHTAAGKKLQIDLSNK